MASSSGRCGYNFDLSLSNQKKPPRRKREARLATHVRSARGKLLRVCIKWNGSSICAIFFRLYLNVEDTAADEGQPADEGEVVPRQQRRARNLQARAAALRRARAAVGGQENGEEGEGKCSCDLRVNTLYIEYIDVVGGDDGEFQFQKIGTKKLRKIKEKAERKAMREVCFLNVSPSICASVCKCVNATQCSPSCNMYIGHFQFLYVARRGNTRRPQET